MQLYDQPRRRRRSALRHLLHHRRPARRPARRRRARHSALHRQLRAAVRRDGRLELRARVRRRPHADSVRALQRRSEVRDAGRARRGASAPTASRPATTRGSSETTDAAGTGSSAASIRDKDQSYFLFTLTQEQLAHALFPVGALDKAASARCARELDLPSPTSPTATRSASSPTATTHAFSSRHGAVRSPPAPSATSRRASSARTTASTASRSASARASDCRRRVRLYVVDIDASEGAVTVGPREALERVGARPRPA